MITLDGKKYMLIDDEGTQRVIVRTYSAGVHMGRLVSHEGREVVLAEARRIWRWYGANTLNEIANNGVDAKSKISEPVARITLTEAIEIIPMTSEAYDKVCACGW